MKKLMEFEKKHADKKLFLLRLVVGAIFIAHGTAKFGMWQASPSADMPAMMLWIMRILSIVEPLAGVAMIAGFMVPVMAIIFAVIMLGAIPTRIFVAEVAFTGGWAYELLILTASLVLASHGGGILSMDGKKHKGGSVSTPAASTPAAPSADSGMPTA